LKKQRKLPKRQKVKITPAEIAIVKNLSENKKELLV
jgi:hypothetical protein